MENEKWNVSHKTNRNENGKQEKGIEREELNRKENMIRRVVAVKWILTFGSHSVFQITDPNV